IMLSTAIYKINEKSEKVSQKDLKILSAVILLGIVPFYFILSQPDLGTALITAVIMGTILFVSGISMKYITAISALIASFKIGRASCRERECVCVGGRALSGEQAC